MYKVAIIGAGQLGSRHLQGLKTANHEMSIYVIDKSIDSINIARERYMQVSDNIYPKAIHFCSSIDDLPFELDVVIIATGSKPRASLTKLLLNHSKVYNIVFEKVLFQRLEDYDDIEVLLQNNGVKAWVNCVRRLWNFYEGIQHSFFNTSPSFVVTGGNWGIGCNAIHFIDLYAYLTGCNDYKLDTEGLDKVLYDSKRAGYKEFNGCLSGSFSNNGKFALISSLVDLKETITISNENICYNISESDGICWIRDKNGYRIDKFSIPYQSQLTGLLVDTLLEGKNCNLPSYNESMALHKPLITSLLQFVNEFSETHTDSCPIT